MKASMKLPALEDYAFLSDPNALNTFIIERDGRAWLYGEEKIEKHLCFRHKSKEFPEPLFNFMDWLKGKVKWNWLNGWMPVLRMEDENGNEMRLLAKNEELWMLFKEKAFSYPDEKQLSLKEFETETGKIVSFWNKWINEGKTLPSIHPMIDNAWKSSFVQCKMAFVNCHPRYGVGKYGEFRADGFPPNVLSMVSALNSFEHYQEARDIFSYYLNRFIMDDGSIDYYGPALSEYGALLALAAETSCLQNDKWLKENLPRLLKIFYYIVKISNPLISETGPHLLLTGSPEADTRNDKDAYLHNNMMIWRGLVQLSKALSQCGEKTAAAETRYMADILKGRISGAVKDLRAQYPFIPHRFKTPEIHSFTQDRDTAYANYRYLPEMLESCFLNKDDALKIIKARETLHGEQYGMTVLGWPGFEHCFDNWPVCSYARSLIELEDRARFMNILFGHLLYHQTIDTFTAYESVFRTGTPRHGYSDFCVPSQLTLPRLLAWSFKYRKWNGETVQWNGPDKDDLNQYMPF